MSIAGLESLAFQKASPRSSVEFMNVECSKDTSLLENDIWLIGSNESMLLFTSGITKKGVGWP